MKYQVDSIVKHFFLVFILSCGSYVFGQHNLSGNISGLVVDQFDQRIQFATVQLLNTVDSAMVMGTITDENGKFKFEELSYGRFFLKIRFVGFSPKILELELSKDRLKINLGKIKLTETHKNLEEVVIKGNRNSYKSLINKDVIIPDSSLIKSSMSTLDLMKKIPGLKVNMLNNTVTILGKDNVLVLINGMDRAGNINLKTIIPNEIDRIEIITSPSSKYNSEYTGVINIILKKKQFNGIKLNVDLDYFGTRHNESSLNIEYGVGKFRFFGNYNLYYRNHQQSNTNWRKSITNQNEYINISKSYAEKPKQLGHFYQYGFDYFINSKNTFNFTGDYKVINTNRQSLSSTKTYENGILIDDFKSLRQPDGNYTMQNYSFYYKRDFKNSGTKLTVDINVYKMDFVSGKIVTDTYYDTSGIFLQKVKRIYQNDNNKTSYNLKIDYSQAITNRINYEAGYNFYNRSFDNLYNDDNQIEKFLYREYRNSVYCDFYFNNFGKFSFISGLRIEKTNLQINDSLKNKYTHFVPVAGVMFKPNENNTIRFNYNRRLIRPSFTLLNPFTYQVDSLNYYTGNPYLKPAKKDYFEINYTFKKDKFLISSSVYYNNGKNILGKSVTVIDNIRYVKNMNIAESISFGLQLHSSVTIFKLLQLNPYFDVYYQSFLNTNENNSGYSYSFSLSAEFSFPRNISAGFDLSHPGKQFNLQGYEIDDFTIDDIYVVSPILKGNGMFSVGVINPFSDLVTHSYEKFDNYEMDDLFRTRFRMFVVKFSYSFSKGKVVKKIKRQYNMERNKY